MLQNDIQRNNKNMTFSINNNFHNITRDGSVIMLSVVLFKYRLCRVLRFYCYAECRYAECHHVECHGALTG
jgi:hypothetical protein